MLDLGLTKMALIGVVALIVLGPERLPRVARTAGALFGRAQRYINDVKAEVTREIEIDELRRMKTEFETAAHHVENTIHQNIRQHEDALNEAWRGAGDASIASAGSEQSASSLNTSYLYTAHRNQRKNWRAKKTATPLWYKRATLRRAHVLSGAARVARHTPASLRRAKRFL